MAAALVQVAAAALIAALVQRAVDLTAVLAQRADSAQVEVLEAASHLQVLSHLATAEADAAIAIEAKTATAKSAEVETRIGRIFRGA